MLGIKGLRRMYELAFGMMQEYLVQIGGFDLDSGVSSIRDHMYMNPVEVLARVGANEGDYELSGAFDHLRSLCSSTVMENLCTSDQTLEDLAALCEIEIKKNTQGYSTASLGVYIHRA